MDGGGQNRYTLRTARGTDELEAVCRFRYEHFFKSFSDGYPGLDRAGARLFERHDRNSMHYCAFDSDGKLCAVSTATPAATTDTPAAWREWFQLGRLAPLDPDKVVVSTRMVIHPDHRRTSLFGRFHRFIMERYLEAGFSCALHYCSPGLICRYEGLGHQLYGEAFVVPTPHGSGLLRVPMLIALNDYCRLRRMNPVLAELCSIYAPRTPSVSISAVLPELDRLPNFRLMDGEKRLAYVRSRLGQRPFPDLPSILPPLEYASPLRLGAGLSHAGPAGDGFLCFVLSGAIREQGSDRTDGPGSFVGTTAPEDPSAPFIVLAETEVLVFDRGFAGNAGHCPPGGQNVPGEAVRCGAPL